MGAQISSSRAPKGATPQINVTPLVDVVLVLLIIFMVVIPAMQDGKTIDMVAVQAAESATRDGSEPVKVTIDSEGVFSLEEDDLPRERVLAELVEIYEVSPKRRVLLRGDSKAEYKVIRDFFAEVQEIGFKGVSLAVAVKREWNEEED